MENQFVYVAMFINQKEELIPGYYKIGKSKQWKLRETQLSSTHLPLDAQMIRVFKTNNMKSMETILQVSFEDYRIIKKYKDGKVKRTEWFDITDDEMFHSRIDKLIANLPFEITEIDLTDAINEDKDITVQEKVKLIEEIKTRRSKSRLLLTYEGVDMTQGTSTETYLFTLRKIAEQCSWDVIKRNESRVKSTFEELKTLNPASNESQLKLFDEQYVFTGNNNEVKMDVLNNLIKKLKLDENIEIKGIELSIER